MNKILFISIMLLITASTIKTHAEDYLQIGKRWVVEQYEAPERIYLYENFTIVSDTVVYGKNQKKIEITYPDPYSDYHDPRYLPDKMFLQEENNIIFAQFLVSENYYPSDSYTPPAYKIIDMSKSVGDTVMATSDLNDAEITFHTLDIVEDRVIELYGIERRMLKLRERPTYYETYDFYWIDGIGAHRPNSRNTCDYLFKLLYHANAWYTGIYECYQGDRLIYSRDDFDRILSEYDTKTGLSGLDKITVINDNTTSTSNDVPIYDLMGRVVTNPRPRTLYIQNGKKIIW